MVILWTLIHFLGDWLTAGETPFYLMGQATNFDKCEGSLSDVRISSDIYDNINNNEFR